MQKAKLVVKNFGALKYIKIEVRETVCLIGKQATGKSTLAKLLAILEDEDFRKNIEKSFKEELTKYGLHSFLKEDTLIDYKRGDYQFLFEKGKIIKVNPREKLKEDFDNKPSEVFKKLLDIDLKGISLLDEIKIIKSIEKTFKEIKSNILETGNSDKVDLFNLYEKTLAEFKIFVQYDSIYIPSERNFLHLIAENTLGLINNNVQIPKHILSIGQEYEKAINTIREFPLKLIGKNFTYKREGKSSYIYHGEEDKVNLLESASGLQSIMPILLLVEYAKSLKDTHNFNFVIEEPELNIYPETQHELIKYLIKSSLNHSKTNFQRKNLILTTHSPYVLASLNNLLLAYDKGQSFNKEVQRIIPKSSWLNPKKFIAYQLKNGKAYKIMDDKLGQIKENMIDDASDKFSHEFERILNL